MSLAEREDMKRAMIGSRAFVLDKNKADGFLRQKTDKKAMERIYRNADKFEKNNTKALEYYQSGDCMNDCEHYDNCSNYIYSKGYNKAIDEMVNGIREILECNAIYNIDCISTLAEQLKR